MTMIRDSVMDETISEMIGDVVMHTFGKAHPQTRDNKVCDNMFSSLINLIVKDTVQEVIKEEALDYVRQSKAEGIFQLILEDDLIKPIIYEEWSEIVRNVLFGDIMMETLHDEIKDAVLEAKDEILGARSVRPQRKAKSVMLDNVMDHLFHRMLVASLIQRIARDNPDAPNEATNVDAETLEHSQRE
ncbi:uncharacterized protein SPPG_02359 [Spizellomyces punctatus DAOM BR117]|uniref:Uncharacterized protein n=1 Tax=Spizellomyces punctatus (strain DAOM BR117) TaxID=645134 RepID=A0A0L0HQB9_SPIPD|nr:uncharacterized protein SPPG_02359 [Spizellomyces punctatus DAOM BR117]KND03312.1 hypothetical protein SPPG_02359 [Spizellomyces punctatus DAOM BR117]|eukprot:XP_016611351.1 hypothetical protein SPPG_02359 [Spizellomyces punctatus DAOM BR117]